MRLLPNRHGGVIHKGNPGPCWRRNRGWHGAVTAPVHGYRVRLQHLSAPYQCQLIRGRPHLGPTIAPQQQGVEYQQHQDDIASHAAPPLIVCAVPSADREGGSRALSLYTGFPLPTTLCRAVRAYPELSALMGGQRPSYRNSFSGGMGEVRLPWSSNKRMRYETRQVRSIQESGNIARRNWPVQDRRRRRAKANYRPS